MRKAVAPLATILLTCAAVLSAGGGASAHDRPAPAAAAPDGGRECADVCFSVWLPVRCVFSNGYTAQFSNRCFAEMHACRHHLQIVSCHRV
ncbi:hypothetical protein [Streptomyces syringium]|uniref:hypothetical protein n=1 Tax=Streptomyces syringium TaxID=76729 RepID=UPI0034538A1B